MVQNVNYIHKRGLNVGPPWVLGVLGGVVFVNLTLAFIWYLVERRKYRSLGSRSIKGIAISTYVHPSPSLTSDTKERNSLRSPTYPQIKVPLHDSPRLLYSLPPSPTTPQSPLKPLLLSANLNPNSGLKPASSLKRMTSVRSADSESLYSLASAPIDLHERMFQPFKLDDIPASPFSTPPIPEGFEGPPMPPMPPTGGYQWPGLRIAKRSSRIREELAPETYTRIKWKTQQPTPNYPLSRKRMMPLLPPPPPAASVPHTPLHTRSVSEDSTYYLVPPAKPSLPPAAPPSDQSPEAAQGEQK